ncbi:DEAD-box ATP-dependent RNA helicase 37-like [Rhopalosiphum maidis]|uniref:DEAD-box ATP-dependent RNA helicase 37-like n=1 Tax=Rhopalosiphum maidis TaxID=43146 RepID=UPI000EFE424B|nr:DEAD-box ATP-dependent RNA helicase 37-like [Rhopalosiphum maidis]
MVNIHAITEICKYTYVESDVESDLKQESNIDYRTPGSSRTDHTNKIQKVTVNGMNDVEFKEMQISMKYNGITSVSVNLSHLRYKKTIIIQNYAIPILISGRDMIARTPTGSGKTTAFVVPLLSCILKNVFEINGDGHPSECFDPLAIIVVPTIQRVKNVYNVVSRLITNTEIKCEPLFKINLVPDPKRKIQNGIHILISYPECLAGIVTRGWITFSKLQIIVLDDADSLLKAGYKP